MGLFIGFVIAIGSMLVGYSAMGGGIAVLLQPWEFLIIFGITIGAFIMSNSWATVIDTVRAIREIIYGGVPSRRDYFDILGLLYALMREMRSQGRNEFEQHIENPSQSSIFQKYPAILSQNTLCNFICDYFRLLLVGNIRSEDIEGLMEDEIHTHSRELLRPYHAVALQAETLPAIGIVAAVLGVIKALAAIDQSPQVLAALIGAALVGTFLGIFCSYVIAAPIASKIKMVREKQLLPYKIVRQILLAFLNGTAPQIAVEYGRKIIADKERPTIDEVETEMIGAPAFADRVQAD